MSDTAVRTPPRAAVLDRATAFRLAAAEYRRAADLLAALEPEDWSRPTDCAGWDVRAMAGHVVGMARLASSLPQLAGQQLAARKDGGGIDALTAVQVRRQADLSPAELVDRFTAVGPRAVRFRRRLSRVAGRLPLPEQQVVGDRRETWRVGFLLEVVLTRDTWMHRVDISRATDRPLELTADHDGVLVADVVAEWAGRHGRPYELQLTGPAGGRWSSGAGGPALELDAVEFCRVLSGRGAGTGLLAEQVPF
jgi:uncharacterized protein (TIGR03083 family)